MGKASGNTSGLMEQNNDLQIVDNKDADCWERVGSFITNLALSGVYIVGH